MPIFYKGDERVLFSHIPKTAGTSIYVWFADNKWILANHSLSASFPTGKIFRARYHILQAQLEGPLETNVSPQHSTALTQKKWGSFTSGFCIVRHPVDRFISELKYFFPYFCSQMKIGHPTEDIAAAYIDRYTRQVFSDFKNDPKIRDNHIRPQVDFISELTEILYYENDWKKWIKTQYGLNGSPYRLNQSDNRIQFRKLINKEILELISDFYHIDFDVLGYKKNI